MCAMLRVWNFSFILEQAFLRYSGNTPISNTLSCVLLFQTYDVICVVSEVTPEHKSNLNAVARALTSSGEWSSLSLYITDCSAQ